MLLQCNGIHYLIKLILIQLINYQYKNIKFMIHNKKYFIILIYN